MVKTFKNQLVTIGTGEHARTIDASTLFGQLALIRDGVINIHKIDGMVFEEAQIEYSRRRFAIDHSIWREVPDMFASDERSKNKVHRYDRVVASEIAIAIIAAAIVVWFIFF